MVISHTDLQHKGREVKGVVIHHDTPGIAENSAHAAQQHTGHEEPSTPSEAEIGVDNGCDSKQGNEAAVGGQARAVAVHGILDGTDLQGTISTRAENDGAGRYSGRSGWVGRHSTLDGCREEKEEKRRRSTAADMPVLTQFESEAPPAKAPGWRDA